MLLLCRHGETEANKEHIIQGQSESDLTATGRAQAAALGQELSRRIGAIQAQLGRLFDHLRDSLG